MKNIHDTVILILFSYCHLFIGNFSSKRFLYNSLKKFDFIKSLKVTKSRKRVHGSSSLKS